MSRFRGEYVADRKALHNAVREAAGNRCVRCGHPAGDGHTKRAPCDKTCTHPRDGKMRVLTVHHMTGDKADNRWWNLLALCQACHLTIQGRVIPERVWLRIRTGSSPTSAASTRATTAGRTLRVSRRMQPLSGGYYSANRGSVGRETRSRRHAPAVASAPPRKTDANS